jgi:hypothetical protein
MKTDSFFMLAGKQYQIYEEVCNHQVFPEKRYNIRVSPEKMENIANRHLRNHS